MRNGKRSSVTEAQRAPVGVRAARCNGGNDSRRLRLVIDAKQAKRRRKRRRKVLESQERTMRTVEAEKQHGRRSDSGGGGGERRKREEEKKEEKSWFRGSMELRAFFFSAKRKNWRSDGGVWTDREACVGTRGTGSKMEEGRRKRMKARLGTRGEEERRSREEGKFM